MYYSCFTKRSKFIIKFNLRFHSHIYLLYLVFMRQLREMKIRKQRRLKPRPRMKEPGQELKPLTTTMEYTVLELRQELQLTRKAIMRLEEHQLKQRLRLDLEVS